MNKITMKTYIPLSVLVILIPVIQWAAVTDTKVKAAEKSIDRITKIEKWLSAIGQKLGVPEPQSE